MGYSIGWVVEKRVLYSRVWGVHSAEDIVSSDTELLRLKQEGIPLIHLIMDARDMVTMPTSLGNIQSSLKTIRDPAFGWVVPIGTTNPVTKFMGIMIAKMFRLRFRRVETLEESIAFLKEIDATIPWDKLDTTAFPESDTGQFQT